MPTSIKLGVYRMKSIALLLCIMFYVISCGPSDKELEAKRMRANLKIIEQNRRDSLKAILEQKRIDFIKVEQEKVIGEIKFGMSESKTKKLWKKFLNNHKKSGSFYIGDYKFSGAYRIVRFLNNNSLYYLTLRGYLIRYDEYVVEAPREYKAISNILENKFGKPDYERELIKWYKTDKNYYYTLKYWNIGKKRVEIKLSRSSGTYLTIDVSIYQPEIVEQINRQRELEAVYKAKKEKDAF